MYTVYILFSSKLNKYYTGSTNNLNNRILRHNKGRNKYTKSGVPWKLVYYENFETRKFAVAREMKIKSMKSKNFIHSLIQCGSEHPDQQGREGH
jgi:putative endonuclease